MADLKFDKEIDALIRGKSGEAILSADMNSVSPHLDADAFNAFTENLLMPELRASYIKHLADCGQCRGILANLAASMPAPDEVAAPAAAGQVSITIPWYQKLFAVRNLAYGMGALVLVFSGFIGFTLLNDFEADRASVRNTSSSNTNAQTVAETLSGPMEDVADSDNYSSNTASNAAAIVANSNSSSPAGSVSSSEMAKSTTNRELLDPEAIIDNQPTGTGGVREQNTEDGLTLSAAPPPPAPARAPVMPAPSPRAETERQQAERADETNPAGPSRSAIQSQNRSMDAPQESSRGRSVGGRAAPIKRSGGKTFMLSEGVWYDEAYSGQRTTNINRTSNDYKKLDSELRKITEDVGGTVVVMWKEKAYRIQ